MNPPFAPFDLISAVLWVCVVALCARRGLEGLIVSLIALLFFRPLLGLGQVGVIVALIVGVAASLAMRLAPQLSFRQPKWGHLLGAVGGALLATVLALNLSVSLPLGQDINGNAEYPKRGLPFEDVFYESRLLRVGHDILLYPLLKASGENPALGAGLTAFLHNFLVVGEPWKEG